MTPTWNNTLTLASVYEDMTTLCKMFCQSELKTEMERLQEKENTSAGTSVAGTSFDIKAVHNQEGDEEEEEEEEEEDED